MNKSHLHSSGFDGEPGQTAAVPMRVRVIIDRLKPHSAERYVPILYNAAAIVACLDKRMSKYEQIDMVLMVLRHIPELNSLNSTFEASVHHIFDKLDARKQSRVCECRCV